MMYFFADNIRMQQPRCRSLSQLLRVIQCFPAMGMISLRLEICNSCQVLRTHADVIGNEDHSIRRNQLQGNLRLKTLW